MLKLLDFDNPEMEKNFREKQNNYNNLLNRYVFIVGFISVFGFYFLFMCFTVPEQFKLYTTYMVISELFLLVALCISFGNFSVKIIQYIYFITIIVLNLSVLFASTLFKGVDFYLIHSGFICLMYSSLSFLRLFFKYSLTFTIILIIFYEIIYLFYIPISGYPIVIIHYIFYCTLLVSIVTNYNLEKRERNNFIKLQIIVSDRLKNLGMNDKEMGDL